MRSTARADLARVNGTVNLDATATDTANGSGVASVRLQRFDGSTWINVGSADTTFPYASVDFPASTFPEGTSQLRLLATDRAGHTLTSATLSLIVDLTTDAPVITAPTSLSLHRLTVPITFTNGDPSTPITTTALARPHGSGSFASHACLTNSSIDTTQFGDGDWDIRLSSTDALGSKESERNQHDRHDHDRQHEAYDTTVQRYRSRSGQEDARPEDVRDLTDANGCDERRRARFSSR